jgi:hypothetical protein
VVAALAPLLVALLPGPRIPQVVILLDWPDILREPPQVVLPAFLGVGGEDAGGRRGELGQGSHPLGPSAELATPQELLHA